MAADDQAPDIAEMVQEIPLSTVDVQEIPVSREDVQEPLQEPAQEGPTTAKPKAKSRGKRGPDKAPRAKPKPKARAGAKERVQITPPVEHIIESDSSESADEATLQEIHSLNLLRSIRAYESTRTARRQQLYASWFGR